RRLVLQRRSLLASFAQSVARLVAGHVEEIRDRVIRHRTMVRGALPETVWNNPPVWSRWQQLLPHALAAVDPDRPRDDVPEELCWLLDRAAVYQQTRGEPRAALPLFRRAHSVGRAGLGDDHPITLT